MPAALPGSAREGDMQRPEVRYRGHVLTPVIELDDGMYAATLIMRYADGVQRTTGVLGEFPCPVEALRFALQYGMAEIDQRQLPAPEWTEQQWHERRLAKTMRTSGGSTLSRSN